MNLCCDEMFVCFVCGLHIGCVFVHVFNKVLQLVFTLVDYLLFLNRIKVKQESL